MATVYLNIGLPKTGTTAIQSFMRENEELLKKQGYCYPNFTDIIGYGNKFKNRNGYFLICNSQTKRSKVLKVLEGLAEQYPYIVLSDEIIWESGCGHEKFWADVVDDFKKIGCEVKVVVYLRRQDLFIQSLWNQHIKSRYKRRHTSFEEWLNTKHADFPLDYYKYLKEIEQYVGKENMIVRAYESGQFEGEEHSMFSDFLYSIGLTLTDEYKRKTVKHNLGLRGNFIEIRRLMNGIPEYRKMDDFMNDPLRYANNYRAKKEGGLHADTSMFTYEQQLSYLKQFEEGNRKTAEEFFGRTNGQIFLDPVKELPVWSIDLETMYADVILFATEVFCRQEKEIIKLQKAQAELKLKPQVKPQEPEIESEGFFAKVYRKMRGNFSSEE